MNRMLWNVCASQLGGMHDTRQFAMSFLAAQLYTKQILAILVICLSGMDIMP